MSLLIAAGLATSVRAAGQEKLGLGVIMGVPFGLSGKYWVNPRYAAQAAVGISDYNLVVSGDFLRHFYDVLPRKSEGRLPLYAGMGMKLKTETRTFFGLRFVGGIAFFHSRLPMDFFAEIAPVLRLAPNEGAAFDGGVGVRYYL